MIDENSTKEEVLAAVKADGYELKYASDELRGDREVVLEAVEHSGLALQYASEELQGDRELVLEAVKQDEDALQYVSKKVRLEMAECWQDAIKQGSGGALQYASDELRVNRIEYMKDHEGIEFNDLVYRHGPAKKGNDCHDLVKRVDIRNHNIGSSDYAKRKIQPWDIWLEYDLNPFDADIIKRVLRRKPGEERLDYEKIIHICQECIRQIDNS